MAPGAHRGCVAPGVHRGVACSAAWVGPPVVQHMGVGGQVGGARWAEMQIRDLAAMQSTGSGAEAAPLSEEVLESVPSWRKLEVDSLGLCLAAEIG